MEFAVLFVSWGLLSLGAELFGLSHSAVRFGYAVLGGLFFILAVARARRHPRNRH